MEKFALIIALEATREKAEEFAETMRKFTTSNLVVSDLVPVADQVKLQDVVNWLS